MEYTSLRASTVSPRACSGDRYCAVPMTAAVWVIVADEPVIARAIPKSMTLTTPSRVSITLPGLMSRWMIPARWLNSSAAHTSAVISRDRWTVSRPSCCSTSRSVRPSTYSMTM